MTRMANGRPGVGVWVIVVLSLGPLGWIGCGGRAIPGGPDADEDMAGEGGAPSDNPGRGGRAGSGVPTVPGVPIDVDRVTLPPCTPGFPPSSAGGRDCTYILRQQCFEEQLAACACACSDPDANSCIIGGFLNPDEPQSVICIVL